MTAQNAIRFILAAFLLLLSNVPSSAYDEAKLKDAERSAILLQAQLKSLVGRLNNATLADEALTSNRVTLEKLKAAAAIGTEKAAGPLKEIATQVEGLGVAPAIDAPPEPETIANQRKELNAQLARATAVQKQLTLVGLEADQALTRLTDMQRDNFLQRIFKADKSILNPALWTSIIDSGSLMGERVGNLFKRGISDADDSFNWSGFLIVPLGMGLLGMIFLRLIPSLMSRFGWRSTYSSERNYSGLEKLWFVIWSYVKYLAAVFVLIMLIMSSFAVAGLLTPAIDNLASRISDALEPALLYGGLMYFVTAPRRPQLRLLAIDTSAARTLFAVVTLGYLVYGFGEELSNFATSINFPVSFTVGQTALTALAMIILISTGLVVVRRQAAKGLATEGSTYFLTWFMNFLPLWWILVIVAVIALLFGFIALAYFIAGNLLDTAMLAIAMGLLHAFIDAVSAAIVDPQSRTGNTVRRFSALSDQSIQRTVLVLRTLADAVLIIVTLLILVLLWTVVLFDVAGLIGSLGEGITIGNITLSPKAILTALAVFFVGITVTKYITLWLDRRVLVETQLDKGVQNSLRAVAGYTGYSLAGAFALTAAGVNFSSLALVFGALGVGIGLGLQSVTNNFVSGLILLAERPIRVGDWVVTNAGEGIVKKINVRSTEIETFDNCSIIVPNSNLINGAVSNWTHRDSVGRFAVAVTFVHSVNAKEITEKLIEIVQNHPKIMRHPPSTVQLSKISTVGLEYDIRGHLRDVFDGGIVASDIRLAIATEFSADLLASSLPPVPDPLPKKLASIKK